MSVKTILPIVGVGSAFAIFGLVRAHRKSDLSNGAESPYARRRDSGVRALSVREDDDDLPAFARLPLTPDFWDAASAPDPAPAPDSARPEPARPSSSPEAYDSLDIEDLSLEWLARATQARPFTSSRDATDMDDPAEIPADSISMISDASRRAATPSEDDIEPLSGYDLDETAVPDRPWP